MSDSTGKQLAQATVPAGTGGTVVGDSLSLKSTWTEWSQDFGTRLCRNHRLGHVLGRGMRISSFPIQDRSVVAADDFRRVFLQQSQIQSTLANCIS